MALTIRLKGAIACVADTSKSGPCLKGQTQWPALVKIGRDLDQRAEEFSSNPRVPVGHHLGGDEYQAQTCSSTA